MDKILLINGSPRAPKSHSKRYAALFAEAYPGETAYVEIKKNNHLDICKQMEAYGQVVLVFPLYVDSLPVTLLNFLKTWEENPPCSKPTVSVIINCGFFEYQQNHVAVEMVRLFCKQNGLAFGSVLQIGSGEAILDSPFRGMAASKIRKMAKVMAKGQHGAYHTTMPLTKSMFVRASTTYWRKYGEKFGTTKAQMQTMQIEDET